MMDMSSEAYDEETKERKRRVDMAMDMVVKLEEERLGAMFFFPKKRKMRCVVDETRGGGLSLYRNGTSHLKGKK